MFCNHDKYALKVPFTNLEDILSGEGGSGRGGMSERCLDLLKIVLNTGSSRKPVFSGAMWVKSDFLFSRFVNGP